MEKFRVSLESSLSPDCKIKSDRREGVLSGWSSGAEYSVSLGITYAFPEKDELKAIFRVRPFKKCLHTYYYYLDPLFFI